MGEEKEDSDSRMTPLNKSPGDAYVRLRDLVGELALALCLKGVSSISLILCFTF